MPLFEENTQTKSNQTETNTQTNSSTSPSPQAETGIIKTIGQLLPFAPLVFEQFTGQKLPAMSGTMAEIQLALTNIQTNLSVVVNNQQQLAQRIVNLETQASSQFTNLIQQVQTIQSLRLTHSREKKEIEYNNPHPNKLTEEEY